jgi:hypothetical protein
VVALPQRAVGAPAPVELREVARPVSLARERTLPVLSALEPLLPEGGLRRGAALAVSGGTSLALALLAGPSAAGSWCAAVGLPSLGLVAAAEVGVVLERFPLVAWPRSDWPAVTAALLDALDVVLLCPPSHVRAADARRLRARTRERGAVLVTTGASIPDADVRLAMTAGEWEGLGRGHGHLRARRVEVVATGRGAAARERRSSLWLPAPDGGVQPVAPVEPVGLRDPRPHSTSDRANTAVDGAG